MKIVDIQRVSSTKADVFFSGAERYDVIVQVARGAADRTVRCTEITISSSTEVHSRDLRTLRIASLTRKAAAAAFLPDKRENRIRPSLEEVAEVYSEARSFSRVGTVAAVMSRFGCPRSTANSWVRKAKDAGLIEVAA